MEKFSELLSNLNEIQKQTWSANISRINKVKKFLEYS